MTGNTPHLGAMGISVGEYARELGAFRPGFEGVWGAFKEGVFASYWKLSGSSSNCMIVYLNHSYPEGKEE